MPVFNYIALNERGSEIKGRVEAESQRLAVSSLRVQSLFVVFIQQGKEAFSQKEFSYQQPLELFSTLRRLLPVTTQDLIFFFQQLALMQRSGVTLISALRLSEQQTGKLRLSSAIGRVTKSIQRGNSFSSAIAEERKIFPLIAEKLIQCAEVSGEMDKILDQIAQHLSRRAEQRRSILTSLMYPSVVVLVTLAVAAFLVIKVIPKFATFLSRQSLVLPWTTQMLINVSQFALKYGLFMMVTIFLFIIGFIAVYRTPKGRLIADRIFLRIPVIGKLLTIGAMAQITQMMSILLKSGITLLESLRITAGIVKNSALKGCLAEASEQILAGKDLTMSLRSSVIPPLVPHVVSVGEKSGTLVQVLEELSEFYDKQLQAKTKLLASLIEPVMILIIGGMVGFVYVSFFQAVFSIVGRR